MATAPYPFSFPSAATYPPPPPFPYTFSPCTAPPRGFFPGPAYTPPPAPAYYPFPAATTFHYPPNLPMIPTSKMAHAGTPAGRIATESFGNEVARTAENYRAQKKDEPSSKAASASKSQPDSASLLELHDPATPSSDQVRTFLEDTSVTPRNAYVSKTKQCGSDLLAHRSLLDLSGRLDEHQAQSQHLFDSLQAELSKMRDRLTSLATSMSSYSLSSSTTAGSTTTWTASSPVLSAPSMLPSAATAYVAPQVFGEMPTPRSCPRKYSSPLHYYQEKETPVLSTCVPDGTSKLSEQNLVEMPQSYGFSNLHRRSILLADGTKRSYYALPENYPLELVTPPMSPATGQNMGITAPPSVEAQAAGLVPVCYSSNNNIAGSEMLLVHNLQPPVIVQDYPTGLMEMHVSEEANQENDQLLQWFSKAAETGQTGAYLSYNSDIFDCTPGQQHQVNEKASVNVQQLGAPPWNVLVIDETRTQWHPGDHTRWLLYYSQGHGVAKRETVQWDPGIGTPSSIYFCLQGLITTMLEVQFGATPSFTYATMHPYAFGLGGKRVNASVLIVLAVQGSTSRLMVVMLLNGHEFMEGQLAYMPHHTSISSAVWVRYTIIVLSGWFPSFDNRTKLQWDPGIAVPLYMYIYLDTRAMQTFPWLQNPLLTDLQCQLPMCNSSCVWDPGILIIWDMVLGNTTAYGYSNIEVVIDGILVPSSNLGYWYLQIWDIGTFFTTFQPP